MSWVLTAKVGDKIVCIDDRPFSDGKKSGLSDGEVYEIEGVFEGWGQRPDGSFASHAIVRVCGIRHPQERFYGRNGVGWAAYRFRPVQSRPTDISFAHDILKSVSEKPPVKVEVSNDDVYADVFQEAKLMAIKRIKAPFDQETLLRATSEIADGLMDQRRAVVEREG